MKAHVLIAGGGIGGLTAALTLIERGFRVSVFERSSELKEIGAGARRKIEALLGTRVYLELHIIVEPGWRESQRFVEELDWRNELERLTEEQPEGSAEDGEDPPA